MSKTSSIINFSPNMYAFFLGIIEKWESYWCKRFNKFHVCKSTHFLGLVVPLAIFSENLSMAKYSTYWAPIALCIYVVLFSSLWTLWLSAMTKTRPQGKLFMSFIFCFPSIHPPSLSAANLSRHISLLFNKGNGDQSMGPTTQKPAFDILFSAANIDYWYHQSFDQIHLSPTPR